jgi:hypothetical protein
MSDSDIRPATPEEIAESAAVKALYSARLRARVAEEDPERDGDGEVERATRAAREAARRLLATPAVSEWQVWLKWEVLGYFLVADAREGPSMDHRTTFALECIKTDLLRFGFGSPAV